MMTLAILSSCSIAVALTGVFLGVCACAHHLRRIALELRAIRGIHQARQGLSSSDAVAYLNNLSKAFIAARRESV